MKTVFDLTKAANGVNTPELDFFQIGKEVIVQEIESMETITVIMSAHNIKSNSRSFTIPAISVSFRLLKHFICNIIAMTIGVYNSFKDEMLFSSNGPSYDWVWLEGKFKDWFPIVVILYWIEWWYQLPNPKLGQFFEILGQKLN